MYTTQCEFLMFYLQVHFEVYLQVSYLSLLLLSSSMEFFVSIVVFFNSEISIQFCFLSSVFSLRLSIFLFVSSMFVNCSIKQWSPMVTLNPDQKIPTSVSSQCLCRLSFLIHLRSSWFLRRQMIFYWNQTFGVFKTLHLI